MSRINFYWENLYELLSISKGYELRELAHNLY